MSKLFCFAFLFAACLAGAFAATTTRAPYTRQVTCKDFTSCLCSTVPRMIAAARGRPATATLFNPATGTQQVIDLSKPLSASLRASCAALSG